MTIRDTSQSYSWLSIFFHWITAVAVITLWLIAELAEGAPEAREEELMGYHISIAMTIYLILWARIFWRMANKRPPLPLQNRYLDLLGTWVPVLLLAGLALMLVSGPLMVWSAGFDITVFDRVTIPTPMEKIESLHELMEETHEFGANLLYFGVILHVLGALKHLIIDRDDTLKKILIPGDRQTLR